jgi:probable addiction module antidote protein
MTPRQPKVIPFDAARYLEDGKVMAEYIAAVLESNDRDLLLAALGDVARAKSRLNHRGDDSG